jgi:hypothetical protein
MTGAEDEDTAKDCTRAAAMLVAMDDDDDDDKARCASTKRGGTPRTPSAPLITRPEEAMRASMAANDGRTSTREW